MTIQTKVVWATRPEGYVPGPMGEALQEAMATKYAELVARGIVSTRSTDGAGYRTWPTTEAAQEWIDFVNQQTPKPIEAVIINT